MILVENLYSKVYEIDILAEFSSKHEVHKVFMSVKHLINESQTWIKTIYSDLQTPFIWKQLLNVLPKNTA